MEGRTHHDTLIRYFELLISIYTKAGDLLDARGDESLDTQEGRDKVNTELKECEAILDLGAREAIRIMVLAVWVADNCVSGG